jgi:type IV pilus assembly protein PilM
LTEENGKRFSLRDIVFGVYPYASMGEHQTQMITSNFYKDKPVFGLDIGYSSIKAMQIQQGHKRPQILAYGINSTDPSFFTDGVVTNHEGLAKNLYDLFDRNIIGAITTRRVAVAIPAARTYTRAMALPATVTKKDLSGAVTLEAEQYIPVPVNELYIDFDINGISEKGTDLIAVAVPKRIIDSYMQLFDVIGLEPIVIETTISSASRLFAQTEDLDSPTVLIDFGSQSADITIHNKGLVVTGTVPCGGDIFTDLIAKQLNVSRDEALLIKTKYGMGVSKKQEEIRSALTPVLGQLLKEIRRMIRYYEERFGSTEKIKQVVTLGGGANMPGLSEYMTSELRMPVRMSSPWQELDFAGIQPPHILERSMYITAAGLAMVNPHKAF